MGAEFWMIEPEIAFATLSDDIDLAEDYLKYCLKYVLKNNADDIAYFNKETDKGLVERLVHRVHRDPARPSKEEADQVQGDAILGLRHGIRARTLPYREGLQVPDRCVQLPQVLQSFLHEAERRRRARPGDSPGHGHAGARDWRAHGRLRQRGEP